MRLLSLKIIFLFIVDCGALAAHALTTEDTKLLGKMGITAPRILLHTDQWQVKPSKIDSDGVRYKGQAKSLIEWNEMDHVKWLDFNYWKQQRQQRDISPDWKIKFRQAQQVELIGRVLKCVGECRLYRGENYVNAQYLSRLKEGDELVTAEDSYAWLVLGDGSIARVSPKTSLTLNEFNLGKSSAFYFVRLNHGHIHWQVRKLGSFKKQNLAETDLLFYPLMQMDANREKFSQDEYRQMNEKQRLLYFTRKNFGHKSQYEELNSYLVDNDTYLSKVDTKVFMVTPNSSFLVTNAHFDVFYSINSHTHFRFKKYLNGFESKDTRKISVSAFLRGYNNTKQEDLVSSEWYEIDSNGSVIEEKNLERVYNSIDLFTKRTPTIHLAREILLKSRFKYLYQAQLQTKDLIVEHGYRLWDDDSIDEDYAGETLRRIEFLKEYTRRVETTNLFSLKKVFKSKILDEFDSEYYSYALKSQIEKLKTQYSKKRMVIPELKEIEYYIWTLKYAKKPKEI